MWFDVWWFTRTDKEKVQLVCLEMKRIQCWVCVRQLVILARTDVPWGAALALLWMTQRFWKQLLCLVSHLVKEWTLTRFSKDLIRLDHQGRAAACLQFRSTFTAELCLSGTGTSTWPSPAAHRNTSVSHYSSSQLQLLTCWIIKKCNCNIQVFNDNII